MLGSSCAQSLRSTTRNVIGLNMKIAVEPGVVEQKRS